MFCSKCGKEIMDEAVICPSCGCPTSNFQNFEKKSSDTIHSKEYPLIRKFAREVTPIFVLSIIGIALHSLVGFILALIVRNKEKNIFIPSITTTIPSEIEEFEGALRKLEIASRLSDITIALFVFIVSMFLMILLAMAVSFKP